MKFEREKEPKCTFEVMDRPTVRQQMEYLSLAGGAAGKNLLFRYWEGAQALIIPRSWKCELIPSLDDLDIDETSDPDIVTVITWVGLQVRDFVNNLDNIPKNS